MQSAIQQNTPQVQVVPSRYARTFWSFIHRLLYYLSQWYSSWFNIPLDANISQLLFGVVMKWTDRTSVGEVISIQTTRSVCPKVVRCGEHLGGPFNRRFFFFFHFDEKPAWCAH
ncbi:hypothetical protein I7I48_09914 [Histoplasma ohiense]|nr:hypothetical protein I7I48_09914 [Histoplasma ohiense (nom. inval.)]